MIPGSFSAVQVEALSSLASVLSGASWALIGASAIRCRIPLRRPTFDLAYKNPERMSPQPGLDVPVASLPAIVLLKMIAWQDCNDRDKDLEDIFFIWSEHLPADDERRFKEPVSVAGLEHDDQGAFLSGWDLAMIAETAHRHYVARFLDKMRNEEGLSFARMVRASRVPGDDPEQRVRLRLSAFERGFVAAVDERERSARPSVERGAKLIRGTGPRLGQGELANRLHEAIDRRSMIRFSYEGKPRVGEPHVLGTKNGRVQLLVWQTAGASSSGPLPGWRRFDVRAISALELTGDAFTGARVTRGVRHSAFDRHIAVVSR